MEDYIGLLKVRVMRGTNLVATDLLNRTTDPYVVVRMGDQVSAILFCLPLVRFSFNFEPLDQF